MSQVILAEPAPPTSGLRALLTLAWPIVLARATQSIIGFADALMVAPLGEAALAATTLGGLNTFAIIILPMGMAFIVQSFVAQLRGRGDLGSVSRYALYGLLLALVAGVAGALAIPFVPAALRPLGLAPEVAQLMATYLSIRLLSVAPAVGTEALGNWFGGLGHTRPAMVAGVVAMVSNVGANYLLIEGRLGFPALGVAGAAWGSVFASWCGFGVVAALAWRDARAARAPGAARFVGREFVRVVRFGLPNGVNWFLEFSAFVLFINVVVGHLGTAVLAAFNVVLQLNSVAFMPAFGVASSAAILVGEAIGRRAYDEVWPTVRRSILVSAAWMGSVGLLYLAIPGWLMGLFTPRGVPAEDLVATGTTMLAISCLWQLFDAVGMTLSETLRAAGDTTWAMGARIVLAWGLFMPLSWMAVFWWQGGAGTVMASLILYLAALAGVFSWRFASGRWKSIDLVGSEPVVD